MSTSYCPVLLQLFDNYSYALAGGSIETYAARTTDPLDTFQDLEGEVPNTNPIILDSAGRAEVRVTDGVAYKFVVKDADGNTISTQDDIVVGTAATASENQYLIALTYCGTPGAQGYMGGHTVSTSMTLPANFSGAAGSVQTNPASDYAIDVKKNGSSVGTVTISSAGVFTFVTSGGATVPCAFGDDLTFHAPATVGAAADFTITLVGALA